MRKYESTGYISLAYPKGWSFDWPTIVYVDGFTPSLGEWSGDV